MSNSTDQWQRGGGSLYRQGARDDDPVDAVQVVLGGRTWVIRPADDYELEAHAGKEEIR